jgi:hypothetical protein
MDIVTHAGIGMIAGAPLASSQPELAIGRFYTSIKPGATRYLCRLFLVSLPGASPMRSESTV